MDVILSASRMTIPTYILVNQKNQNDPLEWEYAWNLGSTSCNFSTIISAPHEWGHWNINVYKDPPLNFSFAPLATCEFSNQLSNSVGQHHHARTLNFLSSLTKTLWSSKYESNSDLSAWALEFWDANYIWLFPELLKPESRVASLRVCSSNGI